MAALLDRLRSAREFTVQLAIGKRLRMRRPLAAQMSRFRAGVSLELVAEHVVGWDGITEADLLPGVGSDSPAAFSPELAAEVLMDRPDWAAPASHELVESIKAWLAKQDAAAKN